MNSACRIVAAGFAVALMALPVTLRAQDEKSAQKPAAAEKTPEAAADSTTDGSVDAGGQHIAYTAIAGTLTVGATDEQDGQLGADGKPQPGSQLALSAPKDPADAPPWRACSTWPTSKRTPRPEPADYVLLQRRPRAARPYGCTWDRWSEVCGDGRRPAPDRGAVQAARQSRQPARRERPGIHRRAGHRFWPAHRKDAEKAFWGVDQDGGAFTRFIARFITKYNRWNSPKFVFGESYGTTRSAVISKMLEDDKSIDLNGVILLSQIFNFSAFLDNADNNPGVDLPYILALPTYAATAWYHKKLSPQPAALEPFLKDVEEYSMGRIPARSPRALT